MMEAVSTSETSVIFYQTTRRNIPEDSHLHKVSLFSSSSQWRRCVVGGEASRTLTSALDGGERVAARSDHFTLGERASDTLRIGSGDKYLYTAALEEPNVLLQDLQNSKRWENRRSHNRFSLIREHERERVLFGGGGCLLPTAVPTLAGRHISP
jgi:hypothetical protein